jgi:hypothetical protein
MARTPSNPPLVPRPRDLVMLLPLAMNQCPEHTYAALVTDSGVTSRRPGLAVAPCCFASTLQEQISPLI